MDSKHIKLLNSLYQGKELSIKQIASRYKAKNPADLIYKIRKLGVEVSKRVTSTGTVVYYLKSGLSE